MTFNIAENLSVELHETVPVEFRALYRELSAPTDAGHKFGIPDDLLPVANTLASLHSALGNERQTSKQRKAEADAITAGLKKYGIKSAADIDAYLATKTGEATKDVDNVRQEMLAGFVEKEQSFNQRQTALTGKIHDLLVKQQAAASIASEKGEPALLMDEVSRRCRVVENDAGQFEVHVLNANGDRQYRQDGSPSTVEDVVKLLKADKIYSRAFDAPVVTGANTAQTFGNRGVAGPDRSKMTPAQKIAIGLRELQ